MNDILNNKEYKAWLKELKQKVRQAQLKAAVKVNSTLLEFYWELGADIVEKQKTAKWGSGFLKQLSNDLSTEFPDVKGFSKRNLEQVRRWYLFYSNDMLHAENSDPAIAKQPASQLFQIPWWHNVVIVSKSKTTVEAIFYVQKTLENNWSRSVLIHQIEGGLFEREGKAITNFPKTLPKPQSDLAQQLIKNPYNFDFLTLAENFNEKELEKSLLDHITNFLLELGAGFAFIGRQKALKVSTREFFIDLLFYHTKLHCYVVVELKTGAFEPEYAGKLNFCLKAVDEQIKEDIDKPTIGILLCKTPDKLIVDYALSDINKPMGVSQYELTKSLPDNFKSSLPSIEELEAEFGGEDI